MNNKFSYEDCLVDFLLSKKDIDLLIPELKTYAICKALIKIRPNFLEFIPEEFKTYELCKEAVDKWCFAYMWVPPEHKTYEMSLNVIKRNPRLLCFVPEYHKKYELCLSALRRDPDALEWIPYYYKNFTLYEDTIGYWVYNFGPEAIELIPVCLRSINFYINAIIGNKNCREYVPDNLKPFILKHF